MGNRSSQSIQPTPKEYNGYSLTVTEHKEKKLQRERQKEREYQERVLLYEKQQLEIRRRNLYDEQKREIWRDTDLLHRGFSENEWCSLNNINLFNCCFDIKWIHDVDSLNMSVPRRCCKLTCCLLCLSFCCGLPIACIVPDWPCQWYWHGCCNPCKSIYVDNSTEQSKLVLNRWSQSSYNAEPPAYFFDLFMKTGGRKWLNFTNNDTEMPPIINVCNQRDRTRSKQKLDLMLRYDDVDVSPLGQIALGQNAFRENLPLNQLMDSSIDNLQNVKTIIDRTHPYMLDGLYGYSERTETILHKACRLAVHFEEGKTNFLKEVIMYLISTKFEYVNPFHICFTDYPILESTVGYGLLTNARAHWLLMWDHRITLLSELGIRIFEIDVIMAELRGFLWFSSDQQYHRPMKQNNNFIVQSLPHRSTSVFF
jgi:hypothetical protein